MKAGTTSLFHYLRGHPQVCMAQRKELNFFVEHMNWKRGRDWYERQFRAAGRGVVAFGEASPSYSKHPIIRGVPQRIASLVPNVQLVYLVRHPVERMLSQYRHQLIIGKEVRPIGEALLKNPDYLATSRYAHQIEQYLQYFPRERILVVKSEDFRTARAGTMRTILEFIGVNGMKVPRDLEREFGLTAEKRRSRRWYVSFESSVIAQTAARFMPPFVKSLARNLGTVARSENDPGRPAISDELRGQLEELVRDDVARLRTYMDEHFDGWGLA
jgi:hypothetical protein